MNSVTNAILDAGPPLPEKLRFLSDPTSYAHAPEDVCVVETHMSFVFLAGDRVYKLKKPAKLPFLDFSTLQAREAMCREELRLNHRLAPDVYLETRALTRSPSGALAIGGKGAVVDWLVEMRRLPKERMLDSMMTKGSVSDRDVERLSDRLAKFYLNAERSTIAPHEYVGRFLREQEENRRILTSRDFALDHGRANLILDALEAWLLSDRGVLEERVRSGRIVDGHGDLRPEHICFTDEIAIFDCLEFNAELRQVDPFDELAYLGVECALLDAPDFAPRVVARARELLGDPAPDRLISLYAAFRAALRARLALAHLLDPSPRLPEKWEPLASRYLALAETAFTHRL